MLKAALLASVFLFTGFNTDIENAFQQKQTTELLQSKTNTFSAKQCTFFTTNPLPAFNFQNGIFENDSNLRIVETLQSQILKKQKQLFQTGIATLRLPLKSPSNEDAYPSFI